MLRARCLLQLSRIDAFAAASEISALLSRRALQQALTTFASWRAVRVGKLRLLPLCQARKWIDDFARARHIKPHD